MIQMVLTDDTGSLTLPMLEVPLNVETIENATDVQTLDFNVYTDFVSTKRRWEHTWADLTEDEYDALRGYYDRQFTLFKYPTLSIAYYSVSNIPVRLYLNTKEVIDFCGTVQRVQIGMRETVQLP